MHYKGYTIDIERRLSQHNDETIKKFTSSHGHW
ncbi:MAG: GIY-YIG nuclease family protein [Bacteroidales bacterium]